MKHTHNSQIQSPSKTLLFPQNKYLLIHKTIPFSSATNKTLQDKKNEPGKKVGKNNTCDFLSERWCCWKQASSVMNKLQRLKRERNQAVFIWLLRACHFNELTRKHVMPQLARYLISPAIMILASVESNINQISIFLN